MREAIQTIDGWPVRVHSVRTLVIGSGAAGLKAAVSLHALGHTDVLIATEAWGGGTSANAGSDKQTYYKLSLAGDGPDCARQMAADLFAGGCTHGDIALAEAQHSAQAFYHLVAIGVPFPHDRYGGFPGYRTDHDPRGRGTSVGPLTSRLMVEALSREVRTRGIDVLDRHQVVALLVDREADEARITGAVALDLRAADAEPRVVLFNATTVVLATGGPGGLYADSVYPADQTGSIGLALAAGATAQNLTESQFGLASIAFRWNVSGSYQQVIPRYVSTDPDGGDEREFLSHVFPDMATLGTAIFRKGYQWPFDPRRVAGFGSSLIDLHVYHQRVRRGRRVFLDFTRDPDGGRRLGPFSLDLLHPEAREYLRKSDALGGSPIERLARLNAPAIALYRDHGIDITRERLEIAVCAQHNNGGLRGNPWWESNVRGLFPVGEVNGSHGVYRPGGASLNAGQVGGLRAAMFIARRYAADPPDTASFLAAASAQIRATLAFARQALDAAVAARVPVAQARAEIQARMSRCGAHIRQPDLVREACRDAWSLCERLRTTPELASAAELPEAFRNVDMALAHAVYLESIAEYLERGGRSRGSSLVVDRSGDVACEGLGDQWRFHLNAPGAFVDGHVLEVTFHAATRRLRTAWVPVRPIPEPDTWFETVWKAYREDRVIV
jgi:succinate dehydrogenase/fumarate reductase flavoprotein subunit